LLVGDASFEVREVGGEGGLEDDGERRELRGGKDSVAAGDVEGDARK